MKKFFEKFGCGMEKTIQQVREDKERSEKIQEIIKIENNMKAEDWIKVEDRLPEDGQMCLIITRVSQECYVARWEQRKRIFMVNETNFIGFCKDALTHWMPIVYPKKD